MHVLNTDSLIALYIVCDRATV